MRSRGRRWLRYGLALFFLIAGANHFLNPDFYLHIMPPYLPAHLALVYVSGLAEIAGGLGVLSRRWRSAAGWALVLLLVAVFPVNLHMAANPHLFPYLPDWLLYARLPLQLLLMAWAYTATRPDVDRSNCRSIDRQPVRQ